MGMTTNTPTRDANPSGERPALIEPMEARLLMSGDSIWIDIGHPVMTAQTQSTALLLPAVQAVREAARASIMDGTSNTIMFGEFYK
jgi:hypothetical protein